MKKIAILITGLSFVLFSATAFAEDFDADPEFGAATVEAPSPAFRGFSADDLKSITIQDVLGLFKIGAKANFMYDNHFFTDTSLQPVINPVSGTRLDFGLNIGTPIGDLVLEYNINTRNWNGKYKGNYFYTHINFYNLHSVFGLDPLFVMWLPTGVYASGNSDQMVYRQMDWRLFNAVGYNETAYILFDKDNPAYSTYHADKRISLLGMRGLINSFADYDMFNYAYGSRESFLNEFVLSSMGQLANYLPLPYAEIFLTRSKLEHRYYNYVIDSDDTGKYQFGWNLGFLYTHSFAIDINPGLLIVRPRIDLLLYDLSFHSEPIYYSNGKEMTGEYLPMRTGIEASLAVCYFF